MDQLPHHHLRVLFIGLLLSHKLWDIQVRGGTGGDGRLAALSASMSKWAAERGSRDDISVVCVELSQADWILPRTGTTSAAPVTQSVWSAVAEHCSRAQQTPSRDLKRAVGAQSSAARPPLGRARGRGEDSGSAAHDGESFDGTPWRDGDTGMPASMDIPPVSVTASPLSLAEIGSEEKSGTTECLELQVVAAQRGGKASDEWTGDVVRIQGITDMASFTTIEPQQWDWADRAAYEVSCRPAHDGMCIAEVGGGVEWLVEMCVAF